MDCSTLEDFNEAELEALRKRYGELAKQARQDVRRPRDTDAGRAVR
jgi:hypothetical protein